MNTTVFNDLIEKSSVAIFIFNLSTLKLDYANPAFISLINIDQERLTPYYLRQIIHSEDLDYAQKALSDINNNASTNHVQIRIIVDGKELWIRLTASLSTDQKGEKLIYGNAIDITTELQSQHNFEKYANKKNAILNILAHDLTGPLGVINMLSSSLKSSTQNPDDINQIDTIIKINKQALDLIREFTAREFLETVDINLAKKRVNLSLKVREYVEEYEKSKAEIKRSFSFFTSPDNIFLNVDEPKFFQILNNLTTNSLKFTRENGNITVSMEDKGDFVLFMVKDDGIGIPKEHRDILFDRFTDARRKGLQGEPTIGLGMFVIKKIIEWHKGKVWIDSAENDGTTVYFEIPKE